MVYIVVAMTFTDPLSSCSMEGEALKMSRKSDKKETHLKVLIQSAGRSLRMRPSQFISAESR